MMRRAGPGLMVCLLVAAVGACAFERAPSGRPGAGAAAPPVDSAASAEVYSALRLYYTRVTAREWKLLARSFWPRAVITAVMRPAAGDTERVQTVTIEEALARASAMHECPAGLSDEIARANVVTYGPLADAWVTYRARCGLTRDSATTHYGIDAFHLMRHGAEWRIASLTVTPEIAGEPLGRQP